MKSYKIGIIGPPLAEPEQDKWEALRALAGYGYQGVEGGGLVGETLDESKRNAERLSELGLEAVGTTCSHKKAEELDAAIEHAKALGAPQITTMYGPVESEEQLLEDAKVLEAMSQKCRDAGLRFGYHNHDHEFRSWFRGKGNLMAIEILLEAAPTLSLELDIGWVASGGCDPLQFIRRYPDRIGSLHLRDLADTSPRGQFTGLGLGSARVFECVECAAANGVRWMIVEIGKKGLNGLTPFEGAVAGIFNLRTAGLR